MYSPDPDAGSAFPNGRPESEQPAWRRDFPIDWPQDHYVARRDFTKFLGLTSLAFVIGQLWIGVRSWLRRSQGEPAARLIARLDQVPAGGVLPFQYPGPNDPCLLVRTEEGTVLAYGQKCTHLSCAVIPEVASRRFACPCHKGYFDLASGRPLAGPPRRPLPRIRLEVRGEWVCAVGVEETTV